VPEVQLHSFLTLVLIGGELSASCLSCLFHGKRAPSYHWMGWMIWRRDEFLALAGNSTMIPESPSS